MPLRVTFDLEDKDLRYFKNIIKKAREGAKNVSEAEVIARASEMVTEVKASKVPNFVRSRVESLELLIGMLKDSEWDLGGTERKNVLAALTYFAEPADLIPDSVPVLGFIDDAIMIELVVTELKHEVDAFADFCRYRKEEGSRNRNPDVSRDDWLKVKRRDLHSRMRRRRSSRRSSGSSSRTRFRLF